MRKLKLVKSFNVTRYYGTCETWCLVKLDGEYHVSIGGNVYRPKDFFDLVKGMNDFKKFLRSKGES